MSFHHRIEGFFDRAVLAKALRESFIAGIRPDPLLTVWQWADRFRILPQETTKEHGRYNTDRTPYLREIMENLSASSAIIRTVVMKAAQVGGSEAGLNLLD